MRRWKVLLALIAVDQLVALVVAILINLLLPFKYFPRIFLISLIFSNFIGFTIFGLHRLFLDRMEVSLASGASVKIARFFLSFFGIIFGTELAVLFMNFTFSQPPIKFKSTSHLWLLAANFGIGTLVSLSFISYYLLREKLEKQKVENERLKRLQAEAALKALQARINPHFLFNAFNSILSLVHSSPQLAEKAVLSLSEIFRTAIDLPEKISLEQEFKILSNYLEIEKIRLADRLSYEIELEEGIKDFKLPPFTLQPIAENSIIYCISRTREGGKLKVRAWRDGEKIKISVWDSGCGREIKSGFGLKSVEERLKLIHEDAKLSFKIDDGTEVILEINPKGDINEK